MRARYSRLCSSKSILTINGQYPGPTIYARKGETVVVHVHNKADENVTLHWFDLLTSSPIANMNLSSMSNFPCIAGMV